MNNCPLCGANRSEPKKVRLWEILRFEYTKPYPREDQNNWKAVAQAAIGWFKESLPKEELQSCPHSQAWIGGFNACLDEIHRILEEEEK